MSSFGRVFLVVLTVGIAAYVAQPTVERWLSASGAPRPVAPRAELSDIEKSTIGLFERVAPSVVQVVSLSGRDGSPAGSGTGFVWDSTGHVVTNNHVVENARAVAVRLASGQVTEAEIVGRAPNHDLAVLRLPRTITPPPPVAIGSSADLKVGQSAFAIGNPFGLDQSLTIGVISALKRRLPTSAGREIANVVQTDAAINPGNSGGPLLDSAGRLIGVNTAIFSPSGAYAGIGFAIPVDAVNRVVPELIKNGRVPVPGIGIVAAEETETTRLGVSGVIVARALPGLPAERAGLRGIDPVTGQVGDIIVEANGRSVARLTDLIDELERTGVGSSIKLTVRRGGRNVSVEVPVVDIDRS